ncbi:MAG: hypothetical protein ACYC5Y_15165 [Symbiobacteriia bacterium]
MTIGMAPVCQICRRLNKTRHDALVCTAFPDGIPMEIVLAGTDHTKPHEGDHGLQFDGDPIALERWREAAGIK